MAFRDNRTIINDAEALTGWNFSVNNNARSLFSADPNPIQGSNHIGMAVSSAVEEAYFDLPASINTANKTFYFWVLPQGIMQTANEIVNLTDLEAGVQAVFGDGSQRSGYTSGVGSNATAFRYNFVDPNYINFNFGFTAAGAVTGGQSIVTVAYQGTNSTDPNFTAITEIGVAFQTLADAKGGTENCFIDRIAYSDYSVPRGDGITLFGTITSMRSAYLSQYLASNQAGIIREIGPTNSNILSTQGRLYIGDSATGLENTTFTSTNETILFETVRGPEKTSGITTQGGTGTTTSVIFGSRTGVGTGNNGVTIEDISTDAVLDFSDPNVDTFGIYGSIIRDITADSILFDSAVGTAHEVFQTDFIGCTNVQLGRTEFNSVGFFNSVATGVDSAAVTMIDTTNVSNLFFSSGGTGHAIAIDSATTNQSFTFTNFEYSGYASTTGNTGNEVLINNSGQPITVNVAGGDTPSVDSDGVRGKVTVINNITATISGVLGNTEIKVLPTSGSPYSGNTLNDTLSIATETVSANTFVGDGTTNYLAIGIGGHISETQGDGAINLASTDLFTLGSSSFLNPEGSFVFSNFPGVLQDTNATSPRNLEIGDLVRVTARNNDVNPTLQKFVTLEVLDDGFGDALGTGSIEFLSGLDNNVDFGLSLASTGNLTVGIGNVKPSYTYTATITASGAGTWSTTTSNCTVTPSSGNSGDDVTISFSALGAFSASFGNTGTGSSIALTGTVVAETRNVATWQTFVEAGLGDALYSTVISPTANSETITVEKVDARYQFNVPSGTTLDFLTYRVGSDPILTTGQTITSDNSSFPLSQIGDRNYRNPA